MKLKLISYLVGCAITLLGAYCYLSQPLKVDTVISCQSRHTLINDNLKLDADYGFIIGGNKGELSVHGYSIENGNRINIRRAISFSYTKMDDIYTLYSKRIESFNGDNSENGNINANFPEFFYQPGKDITIKINRDKFDVPIIFVHNMPLFYCNKSV